MMLHHLICQLVISLDREIKARELKAGYYEATFNCLHERKKYILFKIILNVN